MPEPVELEKALSAALESFITNHLAPLQETLQQELAQALQGATEKPVAAGSAALNSACFRITTGRTQTEILQNLLDSTATFAARSALLVVKGNRLSGWRARLRCGVRPGEGRLL